MKISVSLGTKLLISFIGAYEWDSAKIIQTRDSVRHTERRGQVGSTVYLRAVVLRADQMASSEATPSI